MKGRFRAWILLPAVIIGLLVAVLLVSSFQVELGLAEPGKGERAAIAAIIDAEDLSRGAGPEGYEAFSRALLVATVARVNAAPASAADVRVDNLLTDALDCLYALREAWQAQIDTAWDPQAYGSAVYWNKLHPTLALTQQGPVTPEALREAARSRASDFIAEAVDLAD